MSELIFRQSIEINAPVSKVWAVLTKPELAKQFMFGFAPVTDWKVGSTIDWKGVVNHKEVTAVTGKVLAFEPEKLIQYSVFDPQNPDLKDIPSNYTTVTERLTLRRDKVLLEVSQGDFAPVVGGQTRYEHTIAGWGAVIPVIKDLAEKA
jgi:uncharacterized protein YndB with AHSA1/START domain